MDFKSAEEKFQSIENAFHSGRLSDHDYQAAISQIGVQDGAGRQWKIQPYSGQWHVYDRGGWHPARRPPEISGNAAHPENKENKTDDKTWFCSEMGQKMAPIPGKKSNKFPKAAGLIQRINFGLRHGPIGQL